MTADQLEMLPVNTRDMLNRVCPRFFDQVGHETMHASSIVEISIFSLNVVIVRLTKIMNKADKIGHNFRK